MPFKLKEFNQAKFHARTEFVRVVELKDFFDEGEEPGFEVKGLTGIEYAQVESEVKANKDIEKIVSGLLSGKAEDVSTSLKDIMGTGDNVPDELARRLAFFEKGCVKPEGSLELAKKICERFPIDFYAITNKIVNLTGSGQVLKKKSVKSGKTKKSKTPS